MSVGEGFTKSEALTKIKKVELRNHDKKRACPNQVI